MKIAVSFHRKDWELFTYLRKKFTQHKVIEFYCRDLTCHFSSSDLMHSEPDKLNSRLNEPDIILILLRERYLIEPWLISERDAIINLEKKRNAEGKPLTILVALSDNLEPGNGETERQRSVIVNRISSNINFRGRKWGLAVKNLKDFIENTAEARYGEPKKIDVKNDTLRSQYNNTFNAQTTIQGFQQGGEENTQNIYINDNDEFNKALNSLLELIQSSSIGDSEKEECFSNLRSIQKLAGKEMTLQNIEQAKLRLNLLDTTLKGTDIALKAAPYMPQLIALFEGVLK